MRRNFHFTMHALEQMRIRIGDIIDINTRKDLFSLAIPITNKEAYEIVGDPAVLSDRNKRSSKYLLIEFDDIAVQEVLSDNGYDPTKYQGVVAVFVIRQGCCVTFKTNRESEIFENFKELCGSTRVAREKGFRKNYII